MLKGLMGGAGATATVAATAKRAFSFPSSHDTLWMLLNRIGYFSVGEYAYAQSVGYQNYLVEHFSRTDTAVDALVALNYPTTTQSSYTIVQQMLAGTIGGHQARQELQRATCYRGAHADRTMFERTVELFGDHFNIFVFAGHTRILKPADDREVIRANAFGSFKNMLRKSAESGAMMVFLNNDLNTKLDPQENYAREIMELHTLGLTYNGLPTYGEPDVQAVAECLTGWSYEKSLSSTNFGNHVFNQGDHTLGLKVVRGQNIQFDDIRDGEAVLDQLGNDPATVERIASKMISWFLMDSPPPALITQVAATYVSTNANIGRMILKILDEANLTTYDVVNNPKFRRPFTFLMALLRAVGATVQVDVANNVDGGQQLESLLRNTLHQAPFEWAEPSGYPDDIEIWGKEPLARWKAARLVLRGNLSAVTIPSISAMFAPVGGITKATAGQKISALLANGNFRPEDVAAVQNFIDGIAGTPTNQQYIDAVTVGASTPSFWFF